MNKWWRRSRGFSHNLQALSWQTAALTPPCWKRRMAIIQIKLWSATESTLILLHKQISVLKQQADGELPRAHAVTFSNVLWRMGSEMRGPTFKLLITLYLSSFLFGILFLNKFIWIWETEGILNPYAQSLVRRSLRCALCARCKLRFYVVPQFLTDARSPCSIEVCELWLVISFFKIIFLTL